MKKPLSQVYLERYAYPIEFLHNNSLDLNLQLIVTIPCFAENDLMGTMQSLIQCTNPGFAVEIIVVINHPENCAESIRKLNEKTFLEANEWLSVNRRTWLKFHIIKAFDLPARSAGVGLARKIGMDEAFRRFERIKNLGGIISCIDADCRCDPDYYQEVISYFAEHPEASGATVYFEHPIDQDSPSGLNNGIINYELHLRYLTHALRYADFPYATYTLGSTIAIPAYVYMKQGGMNTRKAGEDFYFIQKIACLGNFHEIRKTRIMPSPRVSGRVPFGTGKSMKDWTGQMPEFFMTYNPLIFIGLKKFINIINSCYDHINPKEFLSTVEIPSFLLSYFGNENWISKILECRQSSTSMKVYRYKIFSWLNGLKIIKYLNYSKRNHIPDVPVGPAASWLLKENYKRDINDTDIKELLFAFRTIDRTLNEPR